MRNDNSLLPLFIMLNFDFSGDPDAFFDSLSGDGSALNMDEADRYTFTMHTLQQDIYIGKSLKNKEVRQKSIEAIIRHLKREELAMRGSEGPEPLVIRSTKDYVVILKTRKLVRGFPFRIYFANGTYVVGDFDPAAMQGIEEAFSETERSLLKREAGKMLTTIRLEKELPDKDEPYPDGEDEDENGDVEPISPLPELMEKAALELDPKTLAAVEHYVQTASEAFEKLPEAASKVDLEACQDDLEAYIDQLNVFTSLDVSCFFVQDTLTFTASEDCLRTGDYGFNFVEFSSSFDILNFSPEWLDKTIKEFDWGCFDEIYEFVLTKVLEAAENGEEIILP